MFTKSSKGSPIRPPFWCERGDSNPAEKRPKALEIKGFSISIAIFIAIFTPEIVLEIPGAVGNIGLGNVGIDVVHRAQILPTADFGGDHFRHSQVIGKGSEAMPLRYNKDKRKNPVFSRVSAFVVAYSIPFPTLIVNEKSVE